MKIFLDTANLDEIRRGAELGADIATMPYKVFEQIFQHPLTDRGLETFLKDWAKARESLGEIVEPAAPKTGR
jgi:hypothetical protein